MCALLTDMLQYGSPLGLLFAAFAIWMLVDAIRRREWLWAVFIFIFPPLNAVLYFFLVYRAGAASPLRGFELPGANDRRRVKELQNQIHHLDKAHHHSQLGDVYFHQGKLDKALASYRAALERDPEDHDTQAHYGQCLLRQNRTAEALPFLEHVCAAQPDHDYGHSMMALAETYAALGRVDDAIRTWQSVLQSHTYARARVQLAEIYAQRGQKDAARTELAEVVSDDSHAPAFQRKRDRVWVKRARRLLERLGNV